MTGIITSFDIWRSGQSSNSSDELLRLLQNTFPDADEPLFLRRLPVQTNLAHRIVMEAVSRKRPDYLVLCGMGRCRRLHVERQASNGAARIVSRANLRALIKGTGVRISRYAGDFVCNDLYFRVLASLQRRGLHLPCIFVHVPLLNRRNRESIKDDMVQILRRMPRGSC